ncbi:MAG: peptidase prolyl oligopeptidase active site domain protein [Candidatus Solibacter sp.]|nr:peptidase prolyl oligopeptidase active site domain protein [Candidatus Solibacter sp.]
MKVLFSLALALVGFAADPHLITPDDYFALAAVGDPQISPDGKFAAYTVTRADAHDNRRTSEIWTASLNAATVPRQMTAAQSSTAPRWSPDGRSLAFLSTRAAAGETNPRPQVYLLPLDGGEPRRLTRLPNGVTSFTWSPDGSRLAILARAGTADRPTDTRHYFSSFYKFNARSFFDTLRTHIFVVDARTLESRQLTSGDQRNDLDPQWSPDSTRIAFASERTDQEPGPVDDIWVVPAAGGAPLAIADRHEGTRSPRWSPDGATIAFLAANDDGETPGIFLVPAAGGKSRPASPKLDHVAASLDWRADGSGLLFLAGWKGEQHLFALDLRSGAIEPITSGPREIASVAFHFAARRIAFTSTDAIHPAELFTRSLDGGDERRLTHINDAFVSTHTLSPIERMTYKSEDGLEVDGFLMKPAGWQAGRKYPLVLTIHGGPANMYGVGFSHEFQGYAARGWAVFFTNPRGSSGYGAAFQRAVKLEWAGKAYQDIMNGMDAVLAKNPWIDPDLLGVTGGSYGGFMTNWIVGHTTRFKAAVTLRSISNFTSVEGTRDAAYGHKRDFGGDLYQNFDLYWKYSPVRYAASVKTPTLVLHSDDDQRVPLEQGEQWFRALQHFHVPSEFVIFPRENHELTRAGEPKHLVESLKWQQYWFERYLNANSSAVPPDAPVAK